MKKNKTKWTNETWLQRTVRLFKRDWQLHVCIWIPMIYVFIFRYIPMYGVQIAFRDYSPAPGKGITGSDWVGFKWFIEFMSNKNFGLYLGNTVILSLYTLVVGFPLPIIFALLLNSIKKERFTKAVQTISYMPHFISMVVFVGIMNMVFSPISGIYGNVYRLFGGKGFPIDFRSTAESFRHLYVWSGVWQNLGWNSIIYISALSGVSAELHEAAQIDGATKFQRMLHIDIPSIAPTIAILLIMRCGSLISVGFEKAFLMQSTLNLPVSEILSTYVYKTGFASFKNFSYGSAVGLWNTAINLVLLMIVNGITKKMTEGDVSLF
ncbi:MAG: sugar ABC transporter permease [Tyzzerella sp.]|nr:sugar ABC transporter permease [Tyzzerella sp.]